MSDVRRAKGPNLSGTGRIVLWRGGSLWIGQAKSETGFHAHHSIQVTLADLRKRRLSRAVDPRRARRRQTPEAFRGSNPRPRPILQPGAGAQDLADTH